MPLNIKAIRQQFPALNQSVNGKTPIFFDGPGGSQTTETTLKALRDYFAFYNANLGSNFFSGVKTTEVMQQARESVAALVNAPSADNIVFGATATMLMFNFSRAIGRDWQAGDEIIVTAADHYSNVSSWKHIAKDKGVTVHQIAVDEQTFEIDYDELASKINKNTKLIAFTYASNTLGSVLDAKRIVELAKSVGALTFIDAVHYAPHFSIDVQSLDCDFLVLSAYKFTGPHVAAIYAKTEHLEGLTPYKVEPATELAPNRWEQGTQNFEGLAGMIAAIEYLASLSGQESTDSNLRARLESAFDNIKAYEKTLSAHFLDKLKAIEGVTLYGKKTIEGRSPTFAFRLPKGTTAEFADFCAERVVGVGAGNFYAQGLCEQLGIMEDGGVIRAGCLHYNTVEEIDVLFDLIDEFLAA